MLMPSPQPTDPSVITALEALRVATAALERVPPAPPPDDVPRWLRAREVAAILGISVKHVYELMSRRVLPSVRLNRAVRVPEDELRAYMERVRRDQAPHRPMTPAALPRPGRHSQAVRRDHRS